MFNYYSNPDIMYKGFSDRTIECANNCMKELNNAGISTYDSLSYLINKKGVFYLYSGSQELGFLTTEDDGTDINFKRFISSANKDVGKFYCIAFPCNLEWYPFSNRVIAYRTEESFEGIARDI